MSLVGKKIAHFLVRKELGQGGMGVVYEAEDTRLDRRVALKILNPGLTANDVQRRRFEREARSAAAVQHPSIATIHDVGREGDLQYIVMELVEGRTLAEILKSRPLALEEWLEYAAAAADGLAHAHHLGIIHRDIKPANLIVDRDGRIKILDFGLAKRLDAPEEPPPSIRDRATLPPTTSIEITSPRKAVGTAAYMSPEQARGAQLDSRTDIFSLGSVMYQMATGILPFRRDGAAETLQAVLVEEPPPIQEISPSTPAEAERIVRKAMEKELPRRYQHADELAADLRNLLRDLGSGRISAAAPAATQPARRRRAPSARTLGILGGIAMVALLGLWIAGPLGPGTLRLSREADPSIAVVGFENMDDAGDAENLGRMMMGLLTTELSESGGLRVISTSRVLAALEEAGGDGSFRLSAATRAAGATGAGTMLAGQVGRAGGKIFLTAELVDVESGDVLRSIRHEAGSKAELFSLAETIGHSVRQEFRIRSRSRSGEPFDLAAAITSSPDAYGHFTAGEASLHERQWDEAVEMFRQAVQEDPSFALAYYRLAMAHWWNGNQAEARKTLSAGLVHAGRLSPRWEATYRAFSAYHDGQAGRARQLLLKYVDSKPEIPDIHYLLGEISNHFTRYYDIKFARESFERALAIDPKFKVVLFHLVDACILGEDLESAVRLLEKYEDEDPDDPAVESARVAVLMARGEFEEAEALARTLLDRGQTQIIERLVQVLLMAGEYGDVVELAESSLDGMQGTNRAFALQWRGMARVGLGEFTDGLEDLEEAIRLMEASEGARHWLSGLVSITRVRRAQVFEVTGQLGSALAEIRDAIDGNPDFYPARYWLGRLQARAGAPDDARRTLKALESGSGAWRSPGHHFNTILLGAELAVADGNRSEAVDAMEEMERLPAEHRDLPSQWEMLARVRELAGDNRGAVAAYRRMLSAGSRYPWARPSKETIAIFHLARLLDEVGEPVQAASSYSLFLDRWGSADIPVPVIEEAKRRLSALSSRSGGS